MSFLHRFRGDQGGFGLKPYNAARAAGYTPKQIAAEIGPSGMPLGYRARDAIIRDTAQQAEDLKQQRNTYRDDVQGYKDQIANYDKQLSDYRDQLNNYQSQITGLTGQYQQALGQATDAQAEASRFEDMFNERTAEYETARAEAQRYRDEAVGRQLQGLRMGSTASGSGDTQGAIASLSSGRSGVRAMDDRAVEIEKGIQAESGALSGKGPVVERMVSASRNRPTAQANSERQSTNQSSSYYASRFR